MPMLACIDGAEAAIRVLKSLIEDMKFRLCCYATIQEGTHSIPGRFLPLLMRKLDVIELKLLLIMFRDGPSAPPGFNDFLLNS